VDLSKYEELTGITVPTSKVAYMTAQLKRTQAMLETMLGFTLSSNNVTTNLYNELGKTTRECACPSVDTEDLEDLEDPDEVVGAYRLFEYNPLDQFFHIDPFSTINKVKLVYVKQGDGDNGITIKTFDDDSIRIDLGRDGIGKYIEHCRDCLCLCQCNYNCIQLAVDAEWLWEDESDIPDDLLYVMADMVKWYADDKRHIQSESITTHSYRMFERTAPELLPGNAAVIQSYAGPYGSIVVQPTTGAMPARSGRGYYGRFPRI
jgi:hypothetical protein